jgi:stage III sporulation protein AD
MELIKLCGIAVCAVIFITIIKQLKPDLAVFTSVAACVLLYIAAVTLLQPVINFIDDTINGTLYGPYLPVLLKALGLGLAAQTVADICKDIGETAIASKVELLGKLEIMIISLPLIQNIIALSREMLYR